MIVEQVLRGRTLKTVTVGEVADETDAQILDLAMAHTGESASSLFDMRVERYTLTPDRVNAFLYTD